MRTRQRMLKSLAELGDCDEELEQVEKCMLPECRKSWHSWEPPLLLLASQVLQYECWLGDPTTVRDTLTAVAPKQET